MELFTPFVITNLSAVGLENIRLIGKMKVYAMASITGGPPTNNSEYKTDVDEEGEINPKWNNTRLEFMLHEPSLKKNLLYLHINFHCSRTLGDKPVGQTRVAVKPLFDRISGNITASPAVQYPVVRSSGGEQGSVNFCFAFGKPIKQKLSLQPPPPPAGRPSRTQQPSQVGYSENSSEPPSQTQQPSQLGYSGNSSEPPSQTQQPPQLGYSGNSSEPPSQTQQPPQLGYSENSSDQPPQVRYSENISEPPSQTQQPPQLGSSENSSDQPPQVRYSENISEPPSQTQQPPQLGSSENSSDPHGNTTNQDDDADAQKDDDADDAQKDDDDDDDAQNEDDDDDDDDDDYEQIF